MTAPLTAPAIVPERASRIDAADVVIGLGFLALTGGVALLSVPWALIIAGALLLGGGLLLEVLRGIRR